MGYLLSTLWLEDDIIDQTHADLVALLLCSGIVDWPDLDGCTEDGALSRIDGVFIADGRHVIRSIQRDVIDLDLLAAKVCSITRLEPISENLESSLTDIFGRVLTMVV